ncbi:hypothetical protein KM1_286020 [Entamoeba histolytica HM-3:IMSS]|uniref:HD domain-containing protein n=4 Tax=Entamoeba histolytica TaxID=5759 RepID=B1N2Y8_ENTH1|nr:hypothetical protein EHI_035380 [Entamoeba histolytica HM-1:IMSS]EDS89666.1 hypothetical protein EHI_035380 [Entamoeba histolytica HM-1:IMSS]EMD47281.1 Hypothetical protein EHI5A_220120 [Entamoeba histolytica KU27]EMS12505.1 hypothetical protein KM1_286020 [Entamoeba histolytica HM-3:IMSS]GAT93623.1 hypothetical protein CL6EHI_035380 [Entamoeba histolytica]|eukprot:XP_001913554.1 hypothetical protein EHI_035380 [Entamoeba histolytica HM-1:IMSS]
MVITLTNKFLLIDRRIISLNTSNEVYELLITLLDKECLAVKRKLFHLDPIYLHDFGYKQYDQFIIPCLNSFILEKDLEKENNITSLCCIQNQVICNNLDNAIQYRQFIINYICQTLQIDKIVIPQGLIQWIEISVKNHFIETEGCDVKIYNSCCVYKSFYLCEILHFIKTNKDLLFSQLQNLTISSVQLLHKPFKWHKESIKSIVKSMGIILSDFDISDTYFDHPNSIHGLIHTYRVVLFSLIIGYYTKNRRFGLLASCGSLIHDMARKRDGICTEHGSLAAKTKFNLLKNHIVNYSISETEQNYIKNAVIKHCTGESKPNEDDYIVVSILKDSDALDRCRVGDLDPNYLRFKESKKLTQLSEYICIKTLELGNISFTHFIDIVNDFIN